MTLFDAGCGCWPPTKEYARLLDFPADLFENGPTLERFFRYNVARGEYGTDQDAEAQVQQLLQRARQRLPHQFTRTRPNGTILEVRGLPVADGGFVTIYTGRHRTAPGGGSHRTPGAQRYPDRTVKIAMHWRRARPAGGRYASPSRRLAVMFDDMDNFGPSTTHWSHAVGDRFLCEVAGRLSSAVRDNDIGAHWVAMNSWWCWVNWRTG